MESPMAARSGRSEALGLVEVILAMTLAGSSVVVGKLLSVRIPVFLSAALSLVAALTVMLPLQVSRLAELRTLTAADLRCMLLQALFGIVLFRVCTLYGLRLTTAVHAGIITAAAPAVMALFARFALAERLSPRARVAVAFTAVGLAAVNLQPGPAGRAAHAAAGDLLIACAVGCEALLTVFRKASGGRVSAVTNTTVLVGLSLAMILPIALVELRSFSLAEIDAVGWTAVIYYGAVATVIAYLLWGDGAPRLPAARTGLAMAAMPVAAVLLSAWVLGEEVGPAQALGCAVVVAGIVVGRARDFS